METEHKVGVGIAVFVVLFIIAIIVTMMGFDTVDANHIGVKIRFGEILGTMSAGMQWTGMFTHVEQYDMRMRKLVVDMTGDNSAIDKTGQSIYGTIDVNFRIKPSAETVMKLYKEIGTDEVIADRLNIEPIVREGFKQSTVQYEALEIVNKREEVKEKAIALIKAHFPTDYFELQNVVVTNIDFAKGFKDAIEAKKESEQNALKEKNQVDVVKYQQQQSLEVIKVETEKLRLQREQLNPYLIQQQWIAKWSGNLPNYMLTTPQNANFLLQLPQYTDQQALVNSPVSVNSTG
jgi:regulator of protease activity HflC (stomatin/prohibitin superfamily)